MLVWLWPGHLKILSLIGEAWEVDGKLLCRAALTQAVLGGVTKTQGPHKQMQ